MSDKYAKIRLGRFMKLSELLNVIDDNCQIIIRDEAQKLCILQTKNDLEGDTDSFEVDSIEPSEHLLTIQVHEV